MDPVTVILIGIGALLALVYARARLYNKHCMWYWDNIIRSYRSQCGGITRLPGHSKEFKFKNCPICMKPIALNPFIDRQEGRP